MMRAYTADNLTLDQCAGHLTRKQLDRAYVYILTELCNQLTVFDGPKSIQTEDCWALK